MWKSPGFRSILLACAAGWCAAGTLQAQTVLCVDATATGGSPDGLSWANAYPTLQQALGDAMAGDQIWVAQGTYVPSKEPGGGIPADLRDVSFSLLESVELRGGYSSRVAHNEPRQASGASIVQF